MKRYFCNGKKGYCDRGNDNEIDCTSCEFVDGTGGEFVECPNTNFERIKSMSIEEFSIEFETELCSYIKRLDSERCEKYSDCSECRRDWLESEVSDE